MVWFRRFDGLIAMRERLSRMRVHGGILRVRRRIGVGMGHVGTEAVPISWLQVV